MDKFSEAAAFAIRLHDGTERKGDGLPYILHPMEAATIVSTLTKDQDVLSAAVLHDTIDDAGTTIEEIEQRFGKRVAELVAAETEDKREHLPADQTWLVRKQEAIEVLKNTNDIDVKRVFLGDKLSNMRSFNRDLQKYGDKLWDRFNQKDPKMHAWYYRSIADAMTELQDTPAWKEYDYLIKKIFNI